MLLLFFFVLFLLLLALALALRRLLPCVSLLVWLLLSSYARDRCLGGGCCGWVGLDVVVVVYVVGGW